MKSANKAIALLSVLLPATTFALEISNTHVHSELYQTLNADVQLANTNNIAVKELRITPAPISAYFLRGIEVDPSVNQMSFNVINVDGTPVIKITSAELITEPVLNFLVLLQWPQGELIKKITLLPQLPGQGDNLPIVAANNNENPKEELIKELNNIKNSAENIWQKTLNKILSFTKTK